MLKRSAARCGIFWGGSREAIALVIEGGRRHSWEVPEEAPGRMLGGFWPDPGWGSLGSDAVLVGFIRQRSLAMWVLPWHANWHREIARVYIQFTMLLDAFSVPHSGHNWDTELFVSAWCGP